MNKDGVVPADTLMQLKLMAVLAECANPINHEKRVQFPKRLLLKSLKTNGSAYTAPSSMKSIGTRTLQQDALHAKSQTD